ncbi:hypothetical protein [Candidatus Villigracilis saccharophilus]|uniref:hypothetical protein n=1 Tax=Candidatus Villigracilis saccharophilus TaxID=3140684 RepID=UPI003134E329|nr:hypothetical protein [Anaerolineales bacterium]
MTGSTLKTVVEFGDQQISFHEVRKALKRSEHYIKLADGSVGQIPEEWLEKYKHLWNLAEETEDGCRVSDFHIPLLDKLLEEDEALHPPSDSDQPRTSAPLSGSRQSRPQRSSSGNCAPTKSTASTGCTSCVNINSAASSPTTWDWARPSRC